MFDHNPLIVDTCEVAVPKSKEFRFEKTWISHPDFMDRIGKAWLSSVSARDGMGIFQEKIRKDKDSLKGWGINVRGENLKIKKDLLNELEVLEEMEETCILTSAQCVRKGLPI